jgi:hypothetical protein
LATSLAEEPETSIHMREKTAVLTSTNAMYVRPWIGSEKNSPSDCGGEM